MEILRHLFYVKIVVFRKKEKKQDRQGQPDGAPKPYVPSALFASDSVLRFTLVTDYRGLAGQRDTLRPKGYAGTVRVAAGGGEKAVPVQVYTRGHFRLRPAHLQLFLHLHLGRWLRVPHLLQLLLLAERKRSQFDHHVNIAG